MGAMDGHGIPVLPVLPVKCCLTRRRGSRTPRSTCSAPSPLPTRCYHCCAAPRPPASQARTLAACQFASSCHPPPLASPSPDHRQPVLPSLCRPIPHDFMAMRPVLSHGRSVPPFPSGLRAEHPPVHWPSPTCQQVPRMRQPPPIPLGNEQVADDFAPWPTVLPATSPPSQHHGSRAPKHPSATQATPPLTRDWHMAAPSVNHRASFCAYPAPILLPCFQPKSAFQLDPLGLGEDVGIYCETAPRFRFGPNITLVRWLVANPPQQLASDVSRLASTTPGT
ncbi:hypothetical protein BS50DRAFT_139349 [Corynespora cassiicola Philippines]|uniref:Uncharacterized protein n=1 Tax=Corynespora cassiicola Philippines TaxID=1448308 RepID=A0A2T2N9Y9_CORCC|nr:hypothetical protein BS50DRAFT_139349 [Corynespora cassiicola Philippines]